jgi:hypothetical protein
MEHSTQTQCMKTVYFSLAPTIYAAKSNASIIILDTTNDSYISLIDEAAYFLDILTTHPLLFDNTHYKLENTDQKELNYWIDYFKQENFIISCSTPSEVKHIAPKPKQPGGLIDYKWDTKVSWHPFKEAPLLLILQAFWHLVHTHRTMKKEGISGLQKALKVSAPLKEPTEKEVHTIASAVDAATLIYPQKTYCLAWAATFVSLAQTKGLKSALTIGIQTNPFYAHAWVQVQDRVIHDDPQLTTVLSIIFQEPNQKTEGR